MVSWPRNPERVKKALVLGLVLPYLFVISTLSLPVRYELHRTAWQHLYPVMDYFQFWQNWTMFAPEVTKFHTRYIAEISLANGRKEIWRSPVAGRNGYFENFAKGRFTKLIEQADVNSPLQKDILRDIAGYLARAYAAKSGIAATSVKLYRAVSPVGPLRQSHTAPPLFFALVAEITNFPVAAR